jgi:hypothetical protein
MTYHNTTNQTGKQLDIFSVAAKSQDELILTFARKVCFFSPSHLHKHLIKTQQIEANTPLTSIRRAITNLTKKGKLMKTEEQVKSVYNKPEYVWQFVG